MTKTLPLRQDGQFDEEAKDPGYPILQIRNEQRDWPEKHAKMLATPSYQTSRKFNTDPTSLDKTDLENDAGIPGLGRIESIETDIKNTIATTVPPKTTCDERGHWNVKECNQQCENSVRNIRSSRKTTRNTYKTRTKSSMEASLRHTKKLKDQSDKVEPKKEKPNEFYEEAFLLGIIRRVSATIAEQVHNYIGAIIFFL